MRSYCMLRRLSQRWAASSAVVSTALAFGGLTVFGACNEPTVHVDGQQPFGLDERPKNLTCKTFAPVVEPTRFVDRFPNVELDLPVGLVQRPGDNSRWYVTERGGRVVHFPNDPGADQSDVRVALDLQAVTLAEYDCSMSGVAFPPDFDVSRRAYVGYCYRGPETGDRLQLRVSRFTTGDGGDTFDPASEQVIVALDFPYGEWPDQWAGLHAMNALRFGPDGYLYVAVGDGGPFGRGGGEHAQSTSDLRGSLLRLDVSDLALPPLTKDFAPGRQRVAAKFPADNPFVDGGGHGAIYAYGFRNPWQWHFDRETGRIWLGDVGEGKREEVNSDVQRGGNYGWGILEGFSCTGYFAECDASAFVPPLLDYAHGHTNDKGKAVTGGVVYRGSAIPALRGAYLFGDSSMGRIWAVHGVDDLAAGARPAKEHLTNGVPVSSFAEDQDGEVYVTIMYGNYRGRILALEPTPKQPENEEGGAPELLSETGCFQPDDPKNPVSALIPYEPAAELWSDGAAKRRWFALPDDKKIAINENGSFDFPTGTVIVKEFSLGERRVETRFLVRQEADGRWAGYTYRWSPMQNDALLVGVTSVQEEIGDQTWIYPGQAECFQCHSEAAAVALGTELAQLNHDIFYPTTGRVANQLNTLEHVGLLESGRFEDFPALPRLTDDQRSVEDRARAYLHANCSGCHRPGGPSFASMDFRYQTPLGEMKICDTPPLIDALPDLIASSPRLLAPGDPARSVIYQRILSDDPAVMMPPLARTISHQAAANVVEEWIRTTTSCPPLE